MMAASRAMHVPRNVHPVVVILGATGTGKSKLAIQLARLFDGEVISADSMQVYKGLDVITNKVSTEEQEGVPHHLLGMVPPLAQFTIVDFRDRALPLIDTLLSKARTPVIVGGTNYYIEALLWRQLVDQKEKYPSAEDGDLMLDSVGVAEEFRLPAAKISNLNGADRLITRSTVDGGGHHESGDPENLDHAHGELSDTLGQIASGLNSEAQPTPLTPGPARTPLPGLSYVIVQGGVEDGFATIDVEQSSSQALHKVLVQVDPAMAERLHPNDKRKIVRSLQVYQQYGQRHSDLLQAQRSQEGGGPLGGPLRYHNTCIFWLQTNQEVLDRRLDDRVDGMIEAGLLEELAGFHRTYNQQRLDEKRNEDLYVHGIFQSIGFKEFHPYLTLPAEDKGSEVGQRLLQEGIGRLKVVTRQYARKQLRWVQNRFLKRPGEGVPRVYGLDSTDPSQWDGEVLQPATEILRAIIKGDVPNQRPLEREAESHTDSTTHVCQACDGRVFVGEQQWTGHLTSRQHKKRVRKAKKRAFNERWQQAHKAAEETKR